LVTLVPSCGSGGKQYGDGNHYGALRIKRREMGRRGGGGAKGRRGEGGRVKRRTGRKEGRDVEKEKRRKGVM
jgi:hypothetical protein